MATTPLAQWARARWVSMALAVAWLLDNDVAGSAQQAADLLELGRMLHSQGTDWNRWFDSNFTECMTGDGTKQTGQHCASQRRICPSVLGCSSSDDAPLQLATGVHNVNVGQGIKASGVWFRFDGNRSRLNHSSHAMMANLDAAFGLPTGMYNGGACKDVFFFFWAAAF